LLSILETFAAALKAKFALPGSASPEDQLKPLVADLLLEAGKKFSLSVETRTEIHLSEHKVRPDIAAYVGGLICGYAQTVTYAMFLARLSGAQKLEPAEAAKTLDKNNGLLARALELLGQPDARKELRVGFELLQRSLEALSPVDFLRSRPDLWLYFYEDFTIPNSGRIMGCTTRRERSSDFR
jgi:hypothetical protein